LKDSVTKVASLTDHEIFEMWRTLWSISYVSKEEEAARFLIFQKAIVDHQKNLPGFADRTKQEFTQIFRCPDPDHPPLNAFIFKSDIKDWAELAESFRGIGVPSGPCYCSR
jgi:hypothetical protein